LPVSVKCSRYRRALTRDSSVARAHSVADKPSGCCRNTPETSSAVCSVSPVGKVAAPRGAGAEDLASILLNTPGESASVVTAIEGNPMAKRGRGSQALAAAAIGHFIGGLIGTILLVVLAPTIAKLAVGIGAPDFFAIMVLAFIAVTSVLGRSRVRGFASLLIGLPSVSLAWMR
jgi:tripartite tricarboxylate transporter TctA family protein